MSFPANIATGESRSPGESRAAAAPEASIPTDAANSRRFRLLVVSSDPYPPTRVDVSVLFGEELSGRGHQIDWLLQSEVPCERSYVASWGGGKAWVAATNDRPSLMDRLRKHSAGIWNDARLFRLLRGDAYEAIEVKDKFVSAVFALVAARLYRKKFIYWLSYPFPEEYLLRATDGTARYPRLYKIRGNAFSFLLYRVLLPAADHVFVQSEAMRAAIAAKGVPLAKLTAVPMGVRLKTSEAAIHARRLIPPEERCFLYLGSLGKGRRIDFLLRVHALVLRELPATKLYLVGKAEDAEDERLLVAEAEKLGILSAVVFVGHLPQQQALEYVQEADVCVSPLYPTPVFNVASPTKLVEYMAMGKAVVANTQPDQQLLIEQSGGGYCVPYDEGEFAKAIVALLRAPDLRMVMGELGKRYIQQHRGYGTIADTVEKKMLEIVADGAA
ncbi:MAG TPA: glycosyltransferase family 4 protein [Steroidobacteraceae bacterium]|nr:glycosyltransferase family 4 protein [Steroidobacteraceae bacterium]